MCLEQMFVVNFMHYRKIHCGKPGVCHVPKHTAKGSIHTAIFLPCAATAKPTRQPGVGKAGLCRVLYIGYTAKALPCANLGPRQKKFAAQE